MFDRKRGSCCVLLGVLSMYCGSAWSDASALDEVKVSVMAMLDNETKMAQMEQAERERKALGLQSKAFGPTNNSPSAALSEPIVAAPKEHDAPPPPKVSMPEVVGIWGLGDRLMADVRINGSTIRFQRGARYPQGYGQGSPYTLVSIQTPCVTFLDKGVSRKVCIDSINPQAVNH